MDDDKREELERKHHARYRSHQYAKLMERKQLLRECNYSPSFLKAAVLIDAEKNFLRTKGIRCSQKFLEEYNKKQRSQSLSLHHSKEDSTIAEASNEAPQIDPQKASTSLPPTSISTPSTPVNRRLLFNPPSNPAVNFEPAPISSGTPSTTSLFSGQFTSSNASKAGSSQTSFPTAPVIPVTEPAQDPLPSMERMSTITSSEPIAKRWILVMNTLYHQNKKILKAFTADEAEKGWRRIVKFEIGDLIDKTLQIYKNNEEANQAFGKFMARLQKILSGNAVEHFLDPSIQFSVDLTNQQQVLYLADLITRRIIEMTKIDRRLIPNAVILHDVIAKFLPSFAGYFRSFIATHSYLLQLTLDRFVEVFSKSMKEAGGDPRDFINHCLDDKATVQLFCCIEKTKVTETCKKVHELYGQRLLWEFCLAFDRLPQLPISTMTTMLVFIKYCGDVFSNPSCRYFRQFATLMLPLLMAFADDDVSLAIKEMAEKMDANDLKLHLEKLHSCVQQNVKDHLRAVGSIRFPQ